MEVVAGSYDCMIRGFSIDPLDPEAEVHVLFS